MLEAPIRLISPRPQRAGCPLFVFLPGMDGSGQLLRTQLSGLSQRFDIRCLALSTQNNWSWRKLVERVVDLIDQTGHHRHRTPVYLCGESFGGCLALQVAVHAPQIFDRLILVNPASSFRRLPWMRFGAALSPWLPAPLHSLGQFGIVPFLIAANRVAGEDREALWQAMSAVPPQTASWRLELLNQFDVGRLPIESIEQPVLLIAGKADSLLPSADEAQRLAKRLPRAQVLLLPHSGHACLLEAQVNLYELMQAADFLPAPRSRR
ncbi:MAG: alpha/beta fold hydrolase [Leptolyngbya sp. SIO4C1]|nr:alpha/beta fold hydrolase [Leptolyngbya sp. SIO4C1]